MKRMKNLVLVFFAVLFVGVFSDKALASEEPLGIVPASSADVREVTLENGETFTFRKMIYRDSLMCTNYKFLATALSDETETVMMSVTRDDGRYISFPSAGQISSFKGLGTNYFETYNGTSWINQNITNLSGGAATFRLSYSAEIVWHKDGGRDF